MTRAFLGAMMLAAAPLAAQDSELVGTWRVNFAVMVRVENGATTPVIGGGTLTIAASGDSLIGTLNTDSIPNEPMRPVVQMGGKPKGNTVSLTARGKATINMNGNEREMVSLSTWAVTATGDSLTGTLNRQIQGLGMGPGAQPVTGTRKKV